MPRGHQGTTQRRARISSPPRSRRAAAHCTARQEDRRRPKTRAPPTSANHTHAHATIKQQATLAITPPQRAASTTSSREASARAPTGAAARGAAFLIATRSTITRELHGRWRATCVCRAKRTDHRERAERRCDECNKNALACVRPPNHPTPPTRHRGAASLTTSQIDDPTGAKGPAATRENACAPCQMNQEQEQAGEELRQVIGERPCSRARATPTNSPTLPAMHRGAASLTATRSTI